MATVMLMAAGRAAVRFACADGVTVSDAALSAGFRLATVCQRGGCGACSATLVSGHLARTGPVSVTKTVAEDGSRVELLCRSTPLDDIVLKPVKGWQERSRAPLSGLLGPR